MHFFVFVLDTDVNLRRKKAILAFCVMFLVSPHIGITVILLYYLCSLVSYVEIPSKIHPPPASLGGNPCVLV